MCKTAAKDANATATHASFYLKDPPGVGSDLDNHPRGCFKAACSEDPKGVCYFYNPIGDKPKNPKGQPVCSKKRYSPAHGAGAATADGVEGVKCPTPNYAPIMDEDACLAAADCDDYCTDSDDRVANTDASEYDEFP